MSESVKALNIPYGRKARTTPKSPKAIGKTATNQENQLRRGMIYFFNFRRRVRSRSYNVRTFCKPNSEKKASRICFQSANAVDG